MTEVAGEVADGLLAHGFTTERYLREVTVPALERGLAAERHGSAATSRSPTRASWSPAPTTSGFAAAAKAVKTQLAFYGSTPGLPAGAGAARLG